MSSGGRSTAEENDALRARLALLDEALEAALAEREDAEARRGTLEREHETLRREHAALWGAKEAMEREVRAAKRSAARAPEDAVADRGNAIERYDELSREHVRLRSSRDSELHLTEMIARQRDKMSTVVEKYQEELEELRRPDTDQGEGEGKPAERRGCGSFQMQLTFNHSAWSSCVAL